MPTVLVTGAASGLGLQFLQHYLLQAGNTVLAIDINPIPTRDLSTATTSKLHHETLDITDASALENFASHIKDLPIDLVIHCAGIRGLVPEVMKAHPGDVPRAETIDVMNAETMLRTLNINAIGTFNLIKSILPNLRLSASNPATPKFKPKVIILSSRLGSISNNSTGGGYAYRASKAALNAVVKSFSIDVPEVGFLNVHPGRVETGLVPWKEEGAMSVEDSVRDVVGMIEKLDSRDGWSGKFVDRWWTEIGW